MGLKSIILRFTFFTLLLANSADLFANGLNKSSDKQLVNKLQKILQTQKESDPGISVLVKQNDKVIFKSSNGLANSNTPITADTGFRIGSISKPFTALAIMKLIEQGKLSLEDPVTKFLPKLPSKWKQISILHLLSHRVYISSDFFSDANLGLANLSTNQDLIKFLSNTKLTVKPLSVKRGRYCNSCYVLLAEVVDSASDMKFADYLGESIFKPSNMKNTYIVNKGESIKPKDALNYAKTESFMGIKQYTTGAMAQVSSTEDLNKFIVALKQNKIVSKETLSLMTRAHADLGEDGLYGLGWIIGWGKQPFFSHGGSQDGYQSELFFYPKYDLEIVILSNGGDKTYELQAKIMKQTMRHLKSLEKKEQS